MTTFDYILAFATITPLAVWAAFKIGQQPSLLLVPAMWAVAVVTGTVWGGIWGLFWGVLIGAIAPIAGLIIGVCAFVFGFKAGYERVMYDGA